MRDAVLCALLDAVCAARRCALGAVCAARGLLIIFFASLQRYTDEYLGSANSRLLLLARRCFGSSDEPVRR